MMILGLIAFCCCALVGGINTWHTNCTQIGEENVEVASDDHTIELRESSALLAFEQQVLSEIPSAAEPENRRNVCNPSESVHSDVENLLKALTSSSCIRPDSERKLFDARESFVPELIWAAECHPDVMRRVAAIRVLGLVQPRPETTSTLIRLAQSENDSEQRAAILALGKLRPSEANVLQLLWTAFESEQIHSQFSAAEALVSLGRREPQLLSFIEESLRSGPTSKQLDALRVIDWHDLISFIDADPLLDMIYSADSAAGCQAGRILMKPSSPAEHRDRLLQMLRLTLTADRSIIAILTALQRIECIDNAAEPLIPELLALARSSASRIRSKSILILSKAGTSDIIPYIMDALESEDASVRRWAVYSLGTLGKPAQFVSLRLEQMLTDSDPDVRALVGHVLRQIKSSPE
jgi:HEAT repeat protein